MGKKKIRVRCPVCGMLVWQSRLNKDFPFEFVIQESSGKGYKKIEHKYTTAYVADADPSRVFQAVFAMKMIEKAEALLKEVDSGITVEVDIPDEVEADLEKTYEEVTEAEKEEAEEVEEKEEKQTYEVEVGGVEYEVEIPKIEVEHVKRAGILKRLKSKGKELKEMEAMGEFEIEHDIGGIEYEVELKRKAKAETLPQDTEAEIRGVPVEFIKVDEKTGELCVGEDCFKVKYEPIENTVVIEIDPEAPCSPLMTKVAKMFLKQIVEGRPKFKVREKRKLE